MNINSSDIRLVGLGGHRIFGILRIVRFTSNAYDFHIKHLSVYIKFYLYYDALLYVTNIRSTVTLRIVNGVSGYCFVL